MTQPRLWDAASGSALGDALIGHTGWVHAVAFGRLGERLLLASGGSDATVRLWDAASGSGLGDALIGHTGWVHAVAFGRLGERLLLASGGDDRTVRLWDPATGLALGDPLAALTVVHGLAFCGSLLAVATADAVIVLDVCDPSNPGVVADCS